MASSVIPVGGLVKLSRLMTNAELLIGVREAIGPQLRPLVIEGDASYIEGQAADHCRSP